MNDDDKLHAIEDLADDNIAACHAILDQAVANKEEADRLLDRTMVNLDRADRVLAIARRDKWISFVFLVGTWAAAGIFWTTR